MNVMEGRVWLPPPQGKVLGLMQRWGRQQIQVSHAFHVWLQEDGQQAHSHPRQCNMVSEAFNMWAVPSLQDPGKLGLEDKDLTLGGLASAL